MSGRGIGRALETWVGVSAFTCTVEVELFAALCSSASSSLRLERFASVESFAEHSVPVPALPSVP